VDADEFRRIRVLLRWLRLSREPGTVASRS
jgi:hypothetical protein